jgi:hypothetical protein
MFGNGDELLDPGESVTTEVFASRPINVDPSEYAAVSGNGAVNRRRVSDHDSEHPAFIADDEELPEVPPVDILSGSVSESSSLLSATETDLALLAEGEPDVADELAASWEYEDDSQSWAWVEPHSEDEEDTDPLAEAYDELALLIGE